MEYSFLFPLMQKLCKSIKKCKTYSRKATGLFFPGHGVDWEAANVRRIVLGDFCPGAEVRELVSGANVQSPCPFVRLSVCCVCVLDKSVLSDCLVHLFV